ncbi:ABC transporter substrate-binding protein [Salinibacterium sp. TMP30]|uniref:ABC transporter substrate-binding protein n=1 Tax=Salinibacterium sp. TMP30 TaxID=3138237 RepID=UPI00313A0A51
MKLCKKALAVSAGLFSVALLLSACASTDGADNAAERPTIRVGLDPNLPPLSSLDPDDPSKIIGAEIDMMEATFAHLGYDFELVPQAWSGILPALDSGQVDVMWSILYYTPERAANVDFITYLRADTGVLAKEGSTLKISSTLDLCGLTGAATLGTLEVDLYNEISTECKAADLSGIDVLTFPDPAATVRAVQNERADVATYNAVLVSTIIEQVPGVEQIFIIPQNNLVGVGVAKGNVDLRDSIAEGVAWLQESGTQEDILRAWGIDPDLMVSTEILTQ